MGSTNGRTPSITSALHRGALWLYQRLPRLARRWLVRMLAPSFTVGSICLIERDDGQVLLIRQAYRERWGLPGGLLKRREDPASAARREVYEEVGLDVVLLGEPAVVVDPLPQRIDIVYRARPVSIEAVGSVSPRSHEIVECRWFPGDELPELQPETAHALVVLARSARAPQATPLTSPVEWIDRL